MEGKEDAPRTRQRHLAKHESHSSYNSADMENIYKLNRMSSATRARYDHLLKLLKAIRRCSKCKSIEEAITQILDTAREILECDRATLFLVDDIQEQLVIRAGTGVDKEVRIPWDVGIAGFCYQSGQRENIHDAYKDERFNKETDAKLNYRTRNILCVPIVCFEDDADGNETRKTVAVLQAINKEDADCPGELTPFTAEDELLCDHLSLQMGVIIQNTMLIETTQRAHKQVISLLDIVKSLHSKHLGMASLIFTITERTPGLVDADRCTVYVVDRHENELYSAQGAVEIRIPISKKSLAGYTAATGEVVNIEDAHKDDRFDTSYDKKSGYRTKSVLVLPIYASPESNDKDEIVGILQVINKLHGGAFTEEDIRLLESYLSIAGAMMNTSRLFAHAKKKDSEFKKAGDIEVNRTKTTFQPSLGGFAEGDEGESEEED